MTRLARVIGLPFAAALLGAVVGGAVVAVWTQTLAAQRRSCQQAGGLWLGPDLIGIAVGVLVVVIVSAVGLAVLRVRPLLASVPAALGLAALTVTAADRAVAGGAAPPAWPTRSTDGGRVRRRLPGVDVVWARTAGRAGSARHDDRRGHRDSSCDP